MQKKNCTLVAWTENGQVRMIPSLVQAGAVYYLEKARRLEEGYSEVCNAGDEISWLLRWSGALEDCAVYYLRCSSTTAEASSNPIISGSPPTTATVRRKSADVLNT